MKKIFIQDDNISRILDIKNQDCDSRIKIAEREKSASILAFLANDKSYCVRAAVAKNHNTSEEILAHLAKDVEWVVRAEVAKNPSTTKATLMDLAKNDDEYLNVKIAVAQNSKATADVLDELAKNKEFYYERVLLAVVKNPNTSTKTLAELAKVSWSSIKSEIAKNQSTPDEVIIYIAKEGDQFACQEIARRSNIHVEVAKSLLNIKVI